MIRTVIVEDEPLAIDRLRACLAYQEQVEVIGEARDGQMAVSQINALLPDLIFLDVHLPVLNGFDVLRRVSHQPAVIFTTAHSEFAVYAFEWGAFDYLVKPFDRDRLARSLQRYTERSTARDDQAGLHERLLSANSQNQLKRFFVKRHGTVVPVNVDDIICVCAEDDYSAVHAGGEVHLIHVPLREVARKLDPQHFLRVHRSSIINLRRVRRIEPAGRGAQVYLDSGIHVTASRVGVQRLRDLSF